MAPVDKFFSLEDAVAREVSAVLEPYLDPVAELAGSLVLARDFSGARAVVDSAYVDQEGRQELAAAFRPRVFDAAVLGASRLVPAASTFVASGFMDPTIVDSAVEQHVAMVADVMVDRFKADLHRLVSRAEQLAAEEDEQAVARSDDGVIVRKALSVDDIASRLNRAAFTGRPALASVSANLATSRLTAYGFLNEASRQNVQRFQITEVLDQLTCPICWRTHGQIYEVAEAISQNDLVLRTTDPEQLKQVAPWPNQSKAGLAAYDAMSPAERSAAGYNRPPFHPYCRGQLVPVGTVEPVSPDQYPDDIPAPADTAPEPPIPEPPAFDDARASLQNVADAAGDEFSDAGFSEQFGTDLRDVAGAMFAPMQRRGFTPTSAVARRRRGPRGQVADGWEVTVKATAPSGEPAQFARTFRVGTGKFGTREGSLFVSHNNFILPAADTGAGIGRETLRNTVTAYRRADPTATIELLANIDVGGYAWARYGFLPRGGMAAVREPLLARLEALDIPSDVRAEVRSLIDSDSRTAFWDIADLRFDVGGVPLGRKLMAGKGFSWGGVLDLTDAEAMARFEAYVGRGE